MIRLYSSKWRSFWLHAEQSWDSIGGDLGLQVKLSGPPKKDSTSLPNRQLIRKCDDHASKCTESCNFITVNAFILYHNIYCTSASCVVSDFYNFIQFSMWHNFMCNWVPLEATQQSVVKVQWMHLFARKGVVNLFFSLGFQVASKQTRVLKWMKEAD